MERRDRRSGNARPQPTVVMRALVRELIETVILALIIFLALDFSVQNFRVEGPSMEPTLGNGQHVLVNKIVYLRINPNKLAGFIPFFNSNGGEVFPFHAPNRGEIVIFRFPRDPSRDFVKRVVGVPGDTVEIRQGRLLVNGVERPEPYVVNRDETSMRPVAVPPDSFFVLGDNRRASSDSREWGPVPAENLIGRAWVTYWPFDRLSALGSPGWP